MSKATMHLVCSSGTTPLALFLLTSPIELY